MTDASLSETELLAEVFPGESELARRMRTFEWTSTELGHPSVWPQNLRIALGICLTSKFPMHILWGSSLTLFYNDAYSSFLGHGKHPGMLGRSGREAWSEVWTTIGPMIDDVRATKQASWSDDILMFFERAVPREEVYATFSFSPLLGAGRVDGLFCACTESTQKIVKTRRLETLRVLGIRDATAQTIASACQSSVDALAKNSRDVPFAAIYGIDESNTAVLQASTGLPADHALPRSVSLSNGAGAAWPIAVVAQQQRHRVVDDIASLGLEVVAGPWPELTHSAVVLPIPSSMPDRAAGVLVLGVSPRRVFDAEYQSFFELVAGHIGTGVADAQASEQERKRVEVLAELDRSKTAFFTNISHEFRTPLTLILGPLQDVLRQLPRASPEELAGHLETVRRNAFRLLRLVNALLDFSRIEAGRMRASFEPIDIAAETADLASTFRSVIEHAGLGYSIRCDVVHEPVFVDRSMFEMIVLNLLSNAFKFTHEGSIGVVLRSSGQQVDLTISDTGIGIAQDQLPHIFERFRRVEDAHARTYEGSGIGLSLVRELVHMHGGEIRIESELGQGTSVTATFRKHASHLPADQIKPSRPRPAADATLAFVEEATQWTVSPDPSDPFDITAAGTSPRARVLVVDDNPDVRSYLMRVLSQHWTVSGAGNGKIALAALKKSRFDIVLTDIMMPECDGLELIRAIRSDPALAALPIIVISGRAGEEARIEGLELGADDYLTKPFITREIVARVATHLNLITLRGEALSSRAKDEFLAILSHELRNPLAPITTAIALLRMSGSASQELDVIERQTRHLRHLVDDLLDVARLEAGKVDLETQPIELSAVIARAIESVRPQIEARRQVLNVRVPQVGLVVEADPVRLAQALENLVANAAKYSATEAEIVVEAQTTDAGARVVVRDTGIGLALPLQARVFNPFAQEAQAIDRKPGGLGLGLAISRGFIALHGGTLSAASEGIGQGVEMIVELPLATAGATPSAEPEAEGGKRDESGAVQRVLVVDDNSDSADLLANALTRFGYSVATAYDGVDGLSTADEFHPDACLLDIGLPSMDGYELARQLRDSEKFPSQPRLIAITGYGQPADRKRAAEAGFDAHLTKPIDLENLLGLLESKAQQRRLH